MRAVIQPVALHALDAAVKDIDVYPSTGKLVIGLQFDRPPGVDATSDGRVYLTVQLKLDAAGINLILEGTPIASDEPDANRGIDVSKVMDNLREKILADYKPQYDALLQQAMPS